jgi:hypothetical protein
MTFKQQNPIQIVQRCLCIERVYDLGEAVVKELNPNLVKEYIEVDEDDVEVTKLEFDLEYMLFSAPMHQFELVFGKLEEEAKAIEKARTSSILGLDGKPMKFK